VPAHVRGALLVAPADVDCLNSIAELRGFAPAASTPLGFPAIVVASQDDPYCTIARSPELARAWHARFVDVGACGHINTASQLGDWPAGRCLLDELAAGLDFTLDARLAGDTLAVGESALNLLLLMNDQRYPWLILVPKRADKAELFELSTSERAQLFEESCLVAQSLSESFAAHKINVGALGNVVRQLHVHHVARTTSDPAWPGPVWGHSPPRPYEPSELAHVRSRLRESSLASRFCLW
jgi:diadenosine tetraphosphate (Ap4A) HIT family hydrolase